MLPSTLISPFVLSMLALSSVNDRPRTTLMSSIDATRSISSIAATTFAPTASYPTSVATNTAVSPLGSSTDMFVQGQACRASWIPATFNIKAWKNMTIDLMTGSNWQMTKLATVAMGIDGTDSSITTYNYTCPFVSPNAAIYFLQFSHDNGLDPMWTTRFAIANSARIYFPPPNANQPQGGNPAIPWGQGVLVTTATSSAIVSAQTTSASILADTAQSSFSTAQQSASMTLQHTSTTLAAIACVVL